MDWNNGELIASVDVEEKIKEKIGTECSIKLMVAAETLIPLHIP